MKKIVSLAFVLVLFSTAVVVRFTIVTVGDAKGDDGKFVFASSKTIWVPDNFTSIQEAINNASDGDNIFVRADTYYENVVVNKSISLIGENRETTIIDGNGTGSVIYVTADKVNVTDFTLQNGGSEFPDSGILLSNSDSSCIKQNIVMNNKFGILLLSSSNNNLVDNIVSNNLHGIELYVNSNGNTLVNNIVSNNHAGIYLANSDGNTLVDNTGSDNNFGIVLGWSNDNILINNKVSNSGWTGIRIVDDSNGNILINNTASSNLDGFELTYANDNTLVNNIASYNRRYGIQVGYSDNNEIISNEVLNNPYGIEVQSSSSNNTIYHNNFINNIWQARVLLSPLNTTWDDGYPSGGNYWSDYNGTDANHDGIGDTPYIIDENNQDNYPLMNPYIPPEEMRVLYYELLRKYNELLADFDSLNSIYYELLDSYSKLLADFGALNATYYSLPASYDNLNSTYYTLLSNYSELQGNYNSLQTSYDNLQASYEQLNSSYNTLQDSYGEPQSDQEAITNELSTIRNLMYIFIATTIILIATIVYLVVRKPKVKPELKTT